MLLERPTNIDVKTTVASKEYRCAKCEHAVRAETFRTGIVMAPQMSYMPQPKNSNAIRLRQGNRGFSMKTPDRELRLHGVFIDLVKAPGWLHEGSAK